MSDSTGGRRNKHLILNQAKLRRAHKILSAKAESVPVKRALDFVPSEDERSR